MKSRKYFMIFSILGATNRLDIVDEALLRPGRFDRIIEVPKPDAKGREHILKIHTKKKPLDKKIDMKKIIELTDGFSGADITAVANQAAITALRRYVNSKSKNVKDIKIFQKDLEDAISEVRPPIKKEEAPPEFG
jgi:transitional endoplasmic reticulum ATPase